MKKYLMSKLTILVAVVFFAACSGPLSMKKAAKEVAVKCNPSFLEIKGGKIDATWEVVFPQKYFNKKAGLELTPVLVYENGEEKGPVKMLQGEKVLENYEVIANKGGRTTQKLSFPYKKGMERCRLELRAKLKHKTKTYDFDEPYKLADGAISTELLVDDSGVVDILPDNYKKFTYRTREAEIKYEVNRSNVRKNQLSQDEVKSLKQFVNDALADGKKVEYEGMEISGYASPEGTQTRNDELSVERSQSAQKAFKNLFGKDDQKIEGEFDLKAKGDGEDWDGFRTLVSESNIDDKDLILRVLSMYQDPKVREQEIRNMSKVFTILEKKVLPELRRSVMIAKVKENNYSDQELQNFVMSGNTDNLDPESLLYAATLFNDDATKTKLYQKAAEKYEDEKGINNYAVMLLNQNDPEKLDEASYVLSAIKERTPEIDNNLGVVKLRQGKFDEAKELFKSAGNASAKQNLGILDIKSGNYAAAAEALQGSKTYNEALANILNNDYGNASSVLDNLTDTNGKVDYLKAVLAAKKGDTSDIVSALTSAFSKNSALKNQALNDATFAKIKNMIP